MADATPSNERPPAGAQSAEASFEQALRETELRFSATARATGITLFHQDRDLRYTWIQNPAAGFDPKDVVGRTDDELLRDDLVEDRTRLIAAKRGGIGTGEGMRLEVITRSPYGTRQFHDLVLEPLRNEAGAVVG